MKFNYRWLIWNKNLAVETDEIYIKELIICEIYLAEENYWNNLTSI